MLTFMGNRSVVGYRRNVLIYLGMGVGVGDEKQRTFSDFY